MGRGAAAEQTAVHGSTGGPWVRWVERAASSLVLCSRCEEAEDWGYGRKGTVPDLHGPSWSVWASILAPGLLRCTPSPSAGPLVHLQEQR